MPHKNIITGQYVSRKLKERSKELRVQMTPAESKLWQRLRGGRLQGFHFRRQQIIGRFIVDFYCHQAGLVVEVDGGIHSEQQEYDQERDRMLQDLDLVVLRFTNQDVNHNLDEVLAAILDGCEARRENEDPG
jgi:very-short-patch-repair endonuclease